MARKQTPMAFTAPDYVVRFLKRKSHKQSLKEDKDIKVSHLILEAVINYFNIKEPKDE